MNVIKPTRIREFGKTHARAAVSLNQWLKLAAQARWQSLTDVKKTFGSVDQIKVASGNQVLVFNIAGNVFRLICAVHFNRGKLYVLRFLTHADYSKDNWKSEL